MICQMDISNIKAELDKNIGQKVMIRGAMGRKKFFEEKAIIENTYPDIFRVKSEENVRIYLILRKLSAIC